MLLHLHIADKCVCYAAESRNTEVEIVPADDVSIDCESVSVSSQPPPTSMERLKTLKLSGQPITTCNYSGAFFVGMVKSSKVVRIDSNDVVTDPFISCSGSVESIVASQNRIYILSHFSQKPHVVDVYDICGSRITQWDHSVAHGAWCDMLCVFSDQVAIPDVPNTRIVIYSLTGQVVRHIPILVYGESHVFAKSLCGDSLVISDYGLSLVYRVNITTGGVMWICRGISKPLGVTCHGSRYVLVVSAHKKTVNVLQSDTGKFGLDKTSIILAHKYCSRFQ